MPDMPEDVIGNTGLAQGRSAVAKQSCRPYDNRDNEYALGQLSVDHYDPLLRLRTK